MTKETILDFEKAESLFKNQKDAKEFIFRLFGDNLFSSKDENIVQSVYEYCTHNLQLICTGDGQFTSGIESEYYIDSNDVEYRFTRYDKTIELDIVRWPYGKRK